MDAHVGAVAWDAMAYTARDGSRVMLEPAQARFAEYASRGPGALVVATRPQLGAAAASAITRATVFDDWPGLDVTNPADVSPTNDVIPAQAGIQ